MSVAPMSSFAFPLRCQTTNSRHQTRRQFATMAYHGYTFKSSRYLISYQIKQLTMIWMLDNEVAHVPLLY